MHGCCLPAVGDIGIRHEGFNIVGPSTCLCVCVLYVLCVCRLHNPISGIYVNCL